MFPYILIINLSLTFNMFVETTPLLFVSTGVVLFVFHPIATISDVNNNVSVPPVVLLVIVK